MTHSRTRFSSVVLFPFVILAMSCASGPPPGPSPEGIAGRAARTILVSPFNIVSAMPPALEGSSRIVSDSLVEILEAHGKTVRLIGYEIGRQLWRDSTQEVRRSGLRRNFENAAKVYARKIGEHVEFDALIVPSLFVQNAKMRSRIVRWDGAEQKIERRGNSRGALMKSGSVIVKAASLFLHVLDREGVEIHSKRTGLELMQHMQFGAKTGRGYSAKEDSAGSFAANFLLVDDEPAIGDEERVRAGVIAGLSPFLPEKIPSTPNEQEDSNPGLEPDIQGPATPESP